MLLEPTDKYINYIQKSAHYLNSPKSEFNNTINSVIRGFSFNKAMNNLGVFFKLAAYKCTSDKMKQIVKFHQNIGVQKFMKMNVNVLTPSEQQVADRRSAEVDAYIKQHTTYYHAMFGGGVNYRPSFPFQDYLKSY